MAFISPVCASRWSNVDGQIYPRVVNLGIAMSCSRQEVTREQVVFDIPGINKVSNMFVLTSGSPLFSSSAGPTGRRLQQSNSKRLPLSKQNWSMSSMEKC
jgi:hypothetical protein